MELHRERQTNTYIGEEDAEIDLDLKKWRKETDAKRREELDRQTD